MNNNIFDFVKIYSQSISDDICNYIIQSSGTYPFQPHRWQNYKEILSTNLQDEPLVSELDVKSRLQVFPCIQLSVDQYVNEIFLHFKTRFDINRIEHPRINKYQASSKMTKHVDHIHNIFDGNKKGIPILSVVCLLNDNFQGGDFIMYEDKHIQLSKGDILIFPSNFVYPHRINSITNGTRYSLVTWAY